MNNTIKVLISIGIVFLVGAALYTQLLERKDSSVITIGAVLPLTGEVAAYGTGTKEGIDLAVDLANKNVLGLKFKVAYQDSMSTPKSAVNAMEQLLLHQKLMAVIGENTSTATGAMIPIADRKKIILISPSASAPNLSGTSEFFFRVFPSDDAEGTFMAETIAGQNPTGRVAIIYVNNDYGLGLQEAFKRRSKSLNINIVGEFGYDQDRRDFRSILADIKSLQADAIYLPSYYEDGASLIRQIRELGIPAKLYGATTHEDPKLLEIAGTAAEGLQYPISTGYSPTSATPEVQHFIAKFRDKYGKEPGLLAALGFDCAQLLIQAASTTGTSSSDIQKYLLSSKSLDGAAGTMTFDTNGDVHKPIMLRTINGGKFSDT